MGFSRLGAAPGKVLVPLGNHLHLHPSLPVLHLGLPSLCPTLGTEVGGAQPCLSTAMCPGMGTGQAPSWHSRPRGSGCLMPAPLPPPSLALHVLPEPALGKKSTALPVLHLPSREPRKPRASTATVLPGPPTGDTGGAGQGHGGCLGSLWLMPCWPQPRGCPFWPLRHMKSFVLGLVAQGGAGLELRGSVTFICPHGHTHTGPRALLAAPGSAPTGSARWSRSPSPLPGARRCESQVPHVTNLICSSR